MWLWISICVLVQQLQYFYCEENITTTENIQTITYVDVFENEIADKAKTLMTQYSQTFPDRSTERPVLSSVSDNDIKCDQNGNCLTQTSNNSPEINTHSTQDTQFPVSNEIRTPISGKARTHISMHTSALSETQISERKPTAPSETLAPGITENETLASSLSHTSDSSETPTAIFNTSEILITASNNADAHNRISNTLRNVTWSLVNSVNNSSQYTTVDMEETDGFNVEESNLANHSLIVPQSPVTMHNANNETSTTMLSFLETSSTSTDQTRINQLTDSTTAKVASYFNNVETNLSHLDVVEGTTNFRSTKITPLTESDLSEGREVKVEKNNLHAISREMETMSTNDMVSQSSGDNEHFSVTPHLETSVTTRLPKAILFSTTLSTTEVTEPSSIIIQNSTQKTDAILSTAISDVSRPNEYSSYDAPNTTTITKNYTFSDTEIFDTVTPNIFTNAMTEIVNHTLLTITTTTTVNNLNTSNSETDNDAILTDKSDVTNSFPLFTFETTLPTEQSNTTKIFHTEQQPSSISYESTTNKETLIITIKDYQSNLETTLADSTVTSSLKLDLSSPDVNLNTNPEHVETTPISEEFSTSETYSSNEAKPISTIFSSTFDSNSINANSAEISLNSTEIEYSTDTSSTEIIYNGTTIQYNTRETDHYFKTENITGSETTSGISTVSETATHISGTDFSSEDENVYTTYTSEFTNSSDLFSTIEDNSSSIVSEYIDNSSVLTSQDTSTTLVLREGKNIPFNNSVLLFTKSTESAFATEMTSLNTAQEDLTTMRKKTEIFITQVRAEDLSPNEQANIITAVIQLSEVNYSQELLDQQTVTFHLWVLHAIIEGSMNNSMNSSGNSIQDTYEGVAYANLPSVVYVLPTPVFNGTNLTFSFIAHNFWSNETFSADLILKFLRAHSKQLYSSMNASLTLFLKGLSPDLRTADWLEAIIDKHGIVILTTCLITVGIIVLLILAVVHYRIKHRQSVHCITDVDKLHRNIQEAIGIDLNPAVVILQDEVNEKTVLPNGDKICAMDDDEGWLVPITDVPIAEDSNASVQDTKL